VLRKGFITSKFVPLPGITQDDQIKEDDMCGTCGIHRINEKLSGLKTTTTIYKY
jgi:hypothetical protein